MNKITYINLQKMTDGTFVVDFRGYPFQVTSDYPKKEQYGYEWTFEAISEYAKLHPDEVAEYKEPEIQVPTIDRAEQIKLQLSANDSKSSRSLRAAILGKATDEDIAFLESIEAEQTFLRQELASIDKK